MREENTIASHTVSHLTTMGRTAVEKYDSNDHKDGDSKLSNEILENEAREALEARPHSSEIDQIPMNDSSSTEMTKVKITKVNTSQTGEHS